MSLRYALLGVLEARPMTGYDLAQFFDESTAWVWSAPHSNIYPELKRLEAAGLISGRDETRGERLRRTVYSITDAGRDELRRWTGSPVSNGPDRDPMLLRALFFDSIEPSEAVAVLESFIADQCALIERWEAHRLALLNKDTPLIKERLAHRDADSHDRIAALKANVFTGMILVAEARVAWARREIELVTERPAATKRHRRVASGGRRAPN